MNNKKIKKCEQNSQNIAYILNLYKCFIILNNCIKNYSTKNKRTLAPNELKLFDTKKKRKDIRQSIRIQSLKFDAESTTTISFRRK